MSNVLQCCGGVGCSTCNPAAGIFLSECPDPGTIAAGFHTVMMDSKFCLRRATNAPGLLQNILTGSSYQQTFTNIPQVELNDVNAVTNTAFGQLIVMGSDFKWRALAPPVTANLFLKTNASGDLIFGSAPVATVPDPLSVTTLNVLGTATVQNVVVNGTTTLNGVASGTITSLLGVTAAGLVATQALSQSIAGSMFFESATSPGAVPNENKVNGDYLIIGNRLYDSGSSLINVTTSESITVAVAGKYLLLWSAQGRASAGSSNYGVHLEINGVVVNYGNGRTSGVGLEPNQIFPVSGMEARTLAVGDVIKLLLSITGDPVKSYEARFVAIKFSDP